MELDTTHRPAMRILNHAARTYDALSKNATHNFAASHALSLYAADAVYSFIPKNACSTLRLSLALANGCISSTEDFNWIHQNNRTFQTSLSALVTASYTFTILRCPYARLASVYLDKIVNRDLSAWNLYRLMKRTIPVEEFTFNRFITLLAEDRVRRGDIHWRPQVDFLVYKRYDDYFCLEQFSTAVKTLKEKIDFTVVDARPFTLHGISNLALIDEGDFSNTAPDEIRALKAAGKCPAPRRLYTKVLTGVVSQHYKEDIDMYVALFGKKDLMFS